MIDRKLGRAAILAALLAMIGCSQSTKPHIVDLMGEVTQVPGIQPTSGTRMYDTLATFRTMDACLTQKASMQLKEPKRSFYCD